MNDERDIPLTGQDEAPVQMPLPFGPVREKLVEQFQSWLDRVLETQQQFRTWLERAVGTEEPPGGIPAAVLAEVRGDDAATTPAAAIEACDLYALYSAMTALAQEVKLQGRSFKQLSDNLEPIRDMRGTLDAALDAHKEALSEARRVADEALAQRAVRDRQLMAETESKTRRSFLKIMIDIYERMKRGHGPAAELARNVAEWTRPSWRVRLAGVDPRLAALTENARAIEKGYALSVDRLADVLRDFGVHDIECMGLPFDPARMIAADIEETDAKPDGTVLDVYRPGYELNGEVFQPVQVKVARNRAQASTAIEGD